MTQLEGCIRFWEAKLKDKYLMDLSTVALVEQTVVFLKKLQKLGGEGKAEGQGGYSGYLGG